MTPGEQIACACPGGTEGVQVCNNDGTAYLACNCAVPTTATSSTTAADSTATGAGGEASSTSSAGGGGAGGETSAEGGGSTTGQGGSGGGTTGSGGEDPTATSWLLGFGDAAYEQQVTSIVPRGDGGLIAILRGRGTFDIGDETFASPNDINPVVVSIGADGNVERFLELEGATEWPSISVALPGEGGALTVVGGFCGPVDLGEGTIFNDGCDAFIARYDAGGNLVRAKVLGGPNAQFIVTAVEVDGDLVVVVGGSQSPIDLGGELVDSESRYALARLSGDDDSVVWARGFDLQVDNGGTLTPATLHFDGVDRIVMAGSAANGGSDLGDGYQLGTNEVGYFIAAFDVDGNPTGSRSGPCGSGGIYVTDVGADGDVVFVTSSSNTSPCDLVGAPGEPTPRSFVSRFDADFVETPALLVPEGCNYVPTLDGEGLLIGATCFGPVDFGDGVVTQPNGDDQDFVLVRYDADREPTAVERLGPEGAYAERVVRGANGEMFLGSTTCLDVDLGFGSYEHQGNCDAWVARIDDP